MSRFCVSSSGFRQHSVSSSRRHRMSHHRTGNKDLCSTTKSSVMPFRTPYRVLVCTVAVSLSELELHHISLFCLGSSAEFIDVKTVTGVLIVIVLHKPLVSYQLRQLCSETNAYLPCHRNCITSDGWTTRNLPCYSYMHSSIDVKDCPLNTSIASP